MLDAGAAAAARAGAPWVRYTSSISITPGGRTASRTYLLAKALETMLDDERLGADEIATYVAIQRHSDASAHSIPSQGTLAQKLGKSRPWVNAKIKRLIECDYLEATHRFHAKGGQTSNTYYLPHLDTDVVMIARPHPSRCHRDDTPCPDDDTPCHDGDTNRTDSDLEENLSLSAREGAVFEKLRKGREQTPAAEQAPPTPSSQQQPQQPAHQTQIRTTLDCRLIPEDWQPSPDDLTWAAQTRPDIEDLQRFTAKFIAKLNAAGGTTGPIWAKWRQWLTTETAPRRRPQTAQPRRAPQHQTGHQKARTQQHPTPSDQPPSTATTITPNHDTHTTANTVEARNAAKCQAVLDILNARLNTPATIEIVQDQETPHHVH